MRACNNPSPRILPDARLHAGDLFTTAFSRLSLCCVSLCSNHNRIVHHFSRSTAILVNNSPLAATPAHTATDCRTITCDIPVSSPASELFTTRPIGPVKKQPRHVPADFLRPQQQPLMAPAHRHLRNATTGRL